MSSTDGGTVRCCGSPICLRWVFPIHPVPVGQRPLQPVVFDPGLRPCPLPAGEQIPGQHPLVQGLHHRVVGQIGLVLEELRFRSRPDRVASRNASPADLAGEFAAELLLLLPATSPMLCDAGEGAAVVVKGFASANQPALCPVPPVSLQLGLASAVRVHPSPASVEGSPGRGGSVRHRSPLPSVPVWPRTAACLSLAVPPSGLQVHWWDYIRFGYAAFGADRSRLGLGPRPGGPASTPVRPAHRQLFVSVRPALWRLSVPCGSAAAPVPPRRPPEPHVPLPRVPPRVRCRDWPCPRLGRSGPVSTVISKALPSVSLPLTRTFGSPGVFGSGSMSMT